MTSDPNEAIRQLFSKAEKPSDPLGKEMADLSKHREYLRTKGLQARLEQALDAHRRNPLATFIRALSLPPTEEIKIRGEIEQEIACIDARIADLRSRRAMGDRQSR